MTAAEMEFIEHLEEEGILNDTLENYERAKQDVLCAIEEDECGDLVMDFMDVIWEENESNLEGGD